MAQRTKFTSTQQYLATVAPDVRPILEEIRRIIRRTVPEAKETISYQMPAFKLEYTFIYFAAFKKHIGIYPPVKADKKLAKALLRYRGEKGNLKFPLDEPMPYALIERVVKALAGQYSRESRQR
jgi:uncharacterized protein YdhG (YjbR/CyaY superfamily)